MRRNLPVFFVFSMFLGGMAALKVWSLHSSFADLGLFDWNIDAIASVGQWQFALGGHVQPLMFLFGGLYAIGGNNSYWLVIIQAVFLAMPLLFLPSLICHAAIPKDTVGKIYGSVSLWLPSLAYSFYFPVWFNALFDFHMDHLAVPLGFSFYLACFNKRWALAVMAGVALSLVKEPFALMTIGCGMYILCRQLADRTSESIGQKVPPYLAGIFLVLFGAVYFHLAINCISPYFTGGQRIGIEGSAYSWMGGSFSEILGYLVIHPLQVVREIIGTPRKLVYAGAVLGALAFVPLLSPIELIPALPVLAISLLSRIDNYYGLAHHYTAGLIAPFMVAFVLGLPRAYRLFGRFGLGRIKCTISLVSVMVIIHVLLSPSPVSRFFWTGKVWQYSNDAYVSTQRDKIIKQAILEYVPANINIAVAMQNTVNMSYLVQRKNPLVFPNGVLFAAPMPDLTRKGKPHPVRAEYVVLDFNRPWYLDDKGCDWLYGKCQDPLKGWQFLEIVKKTRQRYATIFEHDGFMILHRNKNNSS